MPKLPSLDADTLWSDWRMLCETIGERRAGTVEEARAAGFVAHRLNEAGLDQVAIQLFPCFSLRAAKAEVSEPKGRGWRRVEARPLVGAPSTPGERDVRGELAWLELPEGARALRPGSLRGKILAVFGPLPTSLAIHRQLIAAAPRAVIHVDDRLPFTWAKNDGVYPYWAREHGMLPTVAVPYLDAWRWRREGVTELKVRVAVDFRPAASQNVIAELPGSDPTLPAVVFTAHHDTQCNNVGADDNASGVVCLLALARVLGSSRPRTRLRTVRFISFGTEEQLSVGSSAYVRQHHVTPRDTGLVINFDSVASPLGHFVLSVAGAPTLGRYVAAQLAAGGLDVALQPELTPFSDHFPFNRAGIPSLWFMRTNFPGGRWQHHSGHDSLENVSVAEIQRLLRGVLPLAQTLAARRRWPFPSQLPTTLHSRARRVGRELYG
ncbi:MAG: Zn-dependent exopeptidase M28 [Verrucomicrobia bacterium]|nr:Zn-dependent exopeptidase M28 [Verrucomicrobiota bacterium]